jgi:cytochrome d ubiquinol oxidase subunit II
MLFATAGALYPTILRSTIDESFTLSAHNAASAPASLAIGLAIWLPAIALATAYFTYLFHSFKGKMSAADRHY